MVYLDLYPFLDRQKNIAKPRKHKQITEKYDPIISDIFPLECVSFQHLKHLDVNGKIIHLISSVAMVASSPKIIPTIATLISRLIAVL